MIIASRALELAKDYLNGLNMQNDNMLSAWQMAVIGEPMIVQNTNLENSYWIVSVKREGKVLGQIDIGPNGRVLGHSYMYQHPKDLSSCPSSVTRISAKKALKLSEEISKRYKNAIFSEPIFVPDGPHNRLAWMIEVRVEKHLISRIFVTPKYVYERKIVDSPPKPGWR